MSRKAVFIVLEGIDGSGKTTLAKSLKDRLEAKGYKTQLTADLNAQKTASAGLESELADAKRRAEEAANKPVPSEFTAKMAALTQEKAKLQDDLVAAQAALDKAKADAAKSTATAASATALAAAEKRIEVQKARLDRQVEALSNPRLK